MAERTKIEWTDATWNALRGCSKVSAGCANCYAEGMAARFSDPGQWGHGIATREGGKHRWTGAVVLDEKALLKPLRWKKPRRVFVTSISDPFHEAVTDEMLDELFAVMALCPQHTFQLLTKRPARMRSYMLSRPADTVYPDMAVLRSNVVHPDRIRVDWPLLNVWLGVSVENQAAAAERIPHLLATPAAVRFISVEPLLAPVDLENVVHPSLLPPEGISRPEYWPAVSYDVLRGHMKGPDDIGLPKLDWVIVGGESGPKARPMHPDWARSLRDRCKAAGVAFLFKQWGEWTTGKGMPSSVPAGHVFDDGYQMARVGKRAAGRLLDGVEHNEFPTEKAVWKPSDLPIPTEG